MNVEFGNITELMETLDAEIDLGGLDRTELDTLSDLVDKWTKQVLEGIAELDVIESELGEMCAKDGGILADDDTGVVHTFEPA